MDALAAPAAPPPADVAKEAVSSTSAQSDDSTSALEPLPLTDLDPLDLADVLHVDSDWLTDANPPPLPAAPAPAATHTPGTPPAPAASGGSAASAARWPPPPDAASPRSASGTPPPLSGVRPLPVPPPAAAAAAGAAPWGAASTTWPTDAAAAARGGFPVLYLGPDSRAYVAVPMPAHAPRPPGSLVVAPDGSLVGACAPRAAPARAAPSAAAAAAAALALGVGPTVPDVPDAWAAAALCDEFADVPPHADPALRRSMSFGDLPYVGASGVASIATGSVGGGGSASTKRRLSNASRDGGRPPPPAGVMAPGAAAALFAPPPTLPSIKRARSAVCLLTGVGALVSEPSSPTAAHPTSVLPPPSLPPLTVAPPPAWLTAPPVPATHGALLGEVVWARMLSFPWWPAQVVPPPPHAHSLRHKPGSIFVIFYGDGNCAWLSPRSLDRFAIGYAKRAAKPRKDLQAAVDDAWRALGVPRPRAGEPLPAGFDATRPALAGLR